MINLQLIDRFPTVANSDIFYYLQSLLKYIYKEFEIAGPEEKETNILLNSDKKKM